jgi:predicted Zn finger-like uncharacterized protein
MKISCQSCQAKYTIADEKVLGKIVKIRCKKCGATIVINGNEGGTSSQSGQPAADGNAYDYAGGAGGEQWTVNVADGDQRTMTLEEISTAYRSGVVNDDTYCWKDGMADWLPVRDVPELASARGGSPDQTQQDQGSAAGYPTPPPPSEDAATNGGFSPSFPPPQAAASSPASSNGNGNGAANGLFGSSPPPAAARRQGGRGGGGADLFGGAAQAGGEDDVMTSAPAGMPQASNDPGKLTGQRNENSVLFSLSALTQNAPKEEAPAQVGGEGSGLIDIRALSASMGSTGDKPKGGHVDDIMNLGGGGAFTAALTAPVLAPPTAEGGMLGLGGEEQRKDNTKLILAAILGAGLLIGGSIVVWALKKPDAPPMPTAATADTAASAAPVASAPPAAAAATVAAAPADSSSAGSAATPPSVGGAVAAAKPAGGAAPHHGGGGGGGGGPAPFAAPAPAPAAGGGGGGGGSKSLDDMMRGAVKPSDAPAPAAAQASTAPFDRGAAAAALGSISVSGCKKSDGPTGSGHIKITFAPNGSVQSAVVDQPPFAGTAVGGCVAGKFRSAHIPAFAGAPVPVGKSFVVE